MKEAGKDAGPAATRTVFARRAPEGLPEPRNRKSSGLTVGGLQFSSWLPLGGHAFEMRNHKAGRTPSIKLRQGQRFPGTAQVTALICLAQGKRTVFSSARETK